MILSTAAEKPDAQHSISYSEYWNFRESPLRWHYQYNQQLEQLVTPDYFSRGKYLHILMEELLSGEPSSERAELGDLPSDAAELQEAVSKWQQIMAGHLGEVLYVEQEVYADVGLVHPVDGLPVLLHGIMDAHTRDRGDRLVMHEHKTSKRRWSARQKTVQPQAHFYAAATFALLGEWPRFMQYNFFLPKGVVETHSLYLNPDETAYHLNQLQLVVNEVRGEHPPAPLCTCLFGNCNFLSLCDAERTGIGSIEDIIVNEYKPRTSRDSTDKVWQVMQPE